MIPEPDKNTDPGNPNNLDMQESVDPDLYVREIDTQYMNSFRDLLNEYIQKLATDISEIAEGLNLSRPLVGEFMKYKRNELPLEDYLDRYIQKTTFSNDPGYDIHHSLGAYYSHTGRLLLYRSQNSKDIQFAGDRLLKAIYYFHRIGLSRKVERNFTLAGRVKVRSQKTEYAKQFKEYSKYLLNKNISKINAPKNENFESAMRSRLHSLEGEYSLIIDENPQESLKSCLKALRGALWLGLNRHIVDNLYTISQCAISLQNRSIQADLESEFPGLGESSICVDKPDDLMYAKFIHNPDENKIAKEIICRLFKIRKEADESTCWLDVADRFKEASQEIWNIWYRTATGDKEGKHPFAEAIEAGTFLAPIDPFT